MSYGTSSYGYDVRCGDDFKIFTNINSTIVDPKKFDEKSFVDFKGPVCIIPPNSFALAGTVEYFRIPRSVLTVCLGKCVTADTRLVDADTGAYVPITEMRWGKSTLAWDGSAFEAGESLGIRAAGKTGDLRAAHPDGIAHSGDSESPISNAQAVGTLGRIAPGRSNCGRPRNSDIWKDAHT